MKGFSHMSTKKNTMWEKEMEEKHKKMED